VSGRAYPAKKRTPDEGGAQKKFGGRERLSSRNDRSVRNIENKNRSPGGKGRRG